MGEYYVADSYKNFEYDETKAYEKSGKLYVDAKCKCDRCMNGVFVCRVENNQPVPHPAYGGVCLKCGGTGFVKKSIRLYTAKEKASLDRQAIRRAEKKAEALSRLGDSFAKMKNVATYEDPRNYALSIVKKTITALIEELKKDEDAKKLLNKIVDLLENPSFIDKISKVEL